MIKRPRALRKGGTIGLIAPSESFNRGHLRAGMKRLSNLGFHVVVGKAAYTHDSFSIGKEYLRAFDINDMFDSQEIDGIMSIAGGMAASQIIPYIDYGTVKKNPKPFIGYSDISVLLNCIYSRTGMITFHGPMAMSKFQGDTKKYMLKAMTETGHMGRMPPVWNTLKHGSCEGRIVGGNLTSLSGILGTKYDVDWRNKIFFWEELLEAPANIAAMLMRFKLAGVFEKIGGMVVGKLKKCDYKKKNDVYGMSVNEIVFEMTKEYRFPIITDFPSGHFDTNITLPIGGMTRIDTREKDFSITESAVS
jgi:muramoyltetrapeptide carboxypeptidase